VKEEALLYMHLLRTPTHITQLDKVGSRIDAFLAEKFNVVVRFDVRDALERLMAAGLVTQSMGGELRAMPLADASRHLHDTWCKLLDAR
jgi:DNA-binding FadR family transcriptional regulator